MDDLEKAFVSQFPHHKEIIQQISLNCNKIYGDKKFIELSSREQRNILIDLNPKSRGQSWENLRISNLYLAWCRDLGEHARVGLAINNHNAVNIAIAPKNYITWDDLLEIESNTDSQYSLIVRLLFEGLTIEEIRNLKTNDVDIENNRLRLVHSERDILVSDRCIEMIEVASSEEERPKGERGWDHNFLENSYYANYSDFVIRKSFSTLRDLSVEEQNIPMSNSGIFLRFKKAFEDKKYPVLNPKEVRISGAIYYGKQILDQCCVLGQEQILLIEEKFRKLNVSKFINISVIERMYGEIESSYVDNFEPLNLDTSSYRFIKIKDRAGQDKFRTKLLDAYLGRCAVTGETCIEVLEAAHIQPHKNDQSNHIQNGILLRTDIHRLFDAGLFTVNEDLSIQISSKLKSGSYINLLEEKQYINRPTAQWELPSKNALQIHKQFIFQE